MNGGEEPVVNRRSVGVVVLATLLVIDGAWKATRNLSFFFRTYDFLEPKNSPVWFMLFGTTIRLETLLIGLLGLGIFAAGLAILFRREWGRKAIISQVGLFILILVWMRIETSLAIWHSPFITREFRASPIFQFSVSRLPYYWMLLLPESAWYGFQMWFFSRPAVKAQFVNSSTKQ